MKDVFIRSQEEQALVDWTRQLAQQLAVNAKQYDEAGRFVDGQIELLQQAGYSALTVPKEYGGRGANLYQMLLAQECLAGGDASAALVMGWHLGITLSLKDTNAWPEAVYRAFCKEVVEGKALVNSCATEPESGSPSRGGKPRTLARLVEGGYAITGKKAWATGCLKLTHILVTASIPELDQTGEFLVLQGARGLSIEETWDTMSMRGSGSHTVVLEDVVVPQDAALDILAPGQKPRRSSDGSGWLLHIPATYLGIAGAARAYAIDYAKRYVPSGLGTPIAEVNHIRDKFGKIEVLRNTARTLLYETARRYDEADAQERLLMRPDLALAKYVATNSAIEIVDLCMRIVGGQSLWRDTPLERYYRDVRAGLHNPPMDDVTLRILAERSLR